MGNGNSARMHRKEKTKHMVQGVHELRGRIVLHQESRDGRDRNDDGIVCVLQDLLSQIAGTPVHSEHATI